jgi:ADP-ribosylglycohydrolase
VDRLDAGPEPLFSLPEGEGAGAPLGAAAGDVAGGANLTGYSSITQTTTIVGYHLLRLGAVDRPSLEAEFVEMHGLEGAGSVYRSLSVPFRRWLETARAGHAEPSVEFGLEPACRVAPIGVWFRRDPGGLVDAAIDVATATHAHAPAIVTAAAVAGAVAAGAFAQTGRDLVFAAAETADRALDRLGPRLRTLEAVEDAPVVGARLRGGADLVDAPHHEVATEVLSAGDGTALDHVVAALVLGSKPGIESYHLIEAAARMGGSPAAAMVGAIVGARTGIRQWPWIVPNDTWFAEIGRRLVDHHAEVRDLPLPYAVEERLLSADAGRAPY